MRCAMCRHPVTAFPATGQRDPYRGCPACGGIFLHPLPTQQTNTVFEGAEGVRRQADREARRKGYFLRHLARLEKAVAATAPHRRLLEIGCGSGVMLTLAGQRGWRTQAIEMSMDLARLARTARPEARVALGDASDPGTWNGTHDAVLALDVLEHVLDPDRLLRNVHDHLEPGGVVLIQTPNTRGLRHRLQKDRWEMRDPRQHLHLFSPRGLRMTLTRSGFAVESLRTVSGSGMETGWRRGLAGAKERLLNWGGLGNALVALGRKV
ncbi:hypothetical protein CSA17_02190 [bacterium DOLJORAL78_65_58]|nr:MAG: hypothetical protein CSB20_01590 [bacterium DOLZORAL124_64_63]PIE76445.1 MAG: hypothetical protein CSA17_02190 [bacterium DOLJORAL78_65_58]